MNINHPKITRRHSMPKDYKYRPLIISDKKQKPLSLAKKKMHLMQTKEIINDANEDYKNIIKDIKNTFGDIRLTLRNDCNNPLNSQTNRVFQDVKKNVKEVKATKRKIRLLEKQKAALLEKSQNNEKYIDILKETGGKFLILYHEANSKLSSHRDLLNFYLSQLDEKNLLPRRFSI